MSFIHLCRLDGLSRCREGSIPRCAIGTKCAVHYCSSRFKHLGKLFLLPKVVTDKAIKFHYFQGYYQRKHKQGQICVFSVHVGLRFVEDTASSPQATKSQARRSLRVSGYKLRRLMWPIRFSWRPTPQVALEHSSNR